MTRKKVMALVTAGIVCMLLFSVLTVLLARVDVAYVPVRFADPEAQEQAKEISIGLSTVNLSFRDSVGYRQTFYKLSGILAIPMFLLLLFPAVGAIMDLIRARGFKNYPKVHFVFFGALVLFVLIYVFFDLVPVNYRPYVEGTAKAMAEYIRDGHPDSSYPSTHVLMAVIFCGICAEEAFRRIKARAPRIAFVCLCVGIGVAVALCRALSGLHWLTDLCGGALFGGSFLCFYLAFRLEVDSLYPPSMEKAGEGTETE